MNGVIQRHLSKNLKMALESFSHWLTNQRLASLFPTWKNFLIHTDSELILALNFSLLDMHHYPISGHHRLLPVHYLSIGNQYLNSRQWPWNEWLLQSNRILPRGIFCNFCHICENKNLNQTPSKSGIHIRVGNLILCFSNHRDFRSLDWFRNFRRLFRWLVFLRIQPQIHIRSETWHFQNYLTAV